MKKFLIKGAAVLCAVVLTAVCMFVPRIALADSNAVTISTSASTVTAGAEFTVTVGFSSSVALFTAQMDVSYPTDMLELVEVSRVDASSAGTGNPFRMTFENDNGAKSATMATVKFKVKSAATDGQKATITVSNAYGSDENFGKVTLANATTGITIASPKSTNASLASLAVAGHTLTPAFSAETNSYTLNVSNSTTAVNVTAAAADSKATVQVSGGSSLAVGKNEVKVIVTAEAGNQNTYVITVNRTAPPVSSKPPVSSSSLSANAQLSALTLSDVKLSFSPSVTEYAANVANDIAEITIETTAQEKNAKVTATANSKNITDGKISLREGQNYIIIKVTAPNGTTTKQYNVVITRAAEQSTSSQNTSSVGTTSSNSASSDTSSEPTSSQTSASEVESEPTSSAAVSSVQASSQVTSSDEMTADTSSDTAGNTSSKVPDSRNSFLNWLRKDRSAAVVHIAYIGGMIICLLGGCMLGYYLRSRKEDEN